MRVYLTLHEKEAARVPLPFLCRIVRATLLAEGSLCDVKSVKLSVAAISSAGIRGLNRKYRGINKETDVLSFPEERAILETGKSEGRVMLGDLMFAPVFVAKAAREDDVPYRHELAYVVAHGVLHLLGYDHEARHFRIQDAAVRAIIKSHKGTRYD